jgi:hypothetical protein
MGSPQIKGHKDQEIAIVSALRGGILEEKERSGRSCVGSEGLEGRGAEYATPSNYFEKM